MSRVVEDSRQLLPHPLRRDERDAVGRRPDGRLRVRVEAPPRPDGEAGGADRAHGSIAMALRRAQPDDAAGEIAEAAGRIQDRRPPLPHQLANRRGEGVHGEVAGAQVVVERRASELGDVDLDVGQHAAGAAGLVQHDEARAGDPIGEGAPEAEGARRSTATSTSAVGEPSSAARTAPPTSHAGSDVSSASRARARRDGGGSASSARTWRGGIRGGHSPKRRLALSWKIFW